MDENSESDSIRQMNCGRRADELCAPFESVSNALDCDPTQSACETMQTLSIFLGTKEKHFDTYTGAVITNDYIPSFAVHFEFNSSVGDFESHTKCLKKINYDV